MLNTNIIIQSNVVAIYVLTNNDHALNSSISYPVVLLPYLVPKVAVDKKLKAVDITSNCAVFFNSLFN